MQGLLDRASMRIARAGKVGGTVQVAGRANYIYARFDANDAATEFECHSGAILPDADDSIYVMLENPANPNSWRLAFWLRNASDVNADAPLRM